MSDWCVIAEGEASSPSEAHRECLKIWSTRPPSLAGVGWKVVYREGHYALLIHGERANVAFQSERGDDTLPAVILEG